MKYQVISSGSKGNLIYVEGSDAKVLIDAGISMRQVKERCSINLKEIDAILVTHEHCDHVGYLNTYMNKLNVPAYINIDSYKEMIRKYKNIDYSNFDFKFIEGDKKYSINSLSFVPLYLSHDTANCFGFVFREKNSSLAYIADTGFIPTLYIELLKMVDHIIIESNHDIRMLNDSERPIFLKERIKSIKGHMSNITCGECLNSILSAGKCKMVTLCHLSEECNTEEEAIDCVLEHINCENIPLIRIAKQYEALPLTEVE